MLNQTDFIFIRPPVAESSLYKEAIKSFESFVDHAHIDSTKSSDPESNRAVIQEAKETIGELARQVGPIAVESVWLWGIIISELYRNTEPTTKMLLRAIYCTAILCQNVSSTKRPTPEAGVLSLAIQSAEYVSNHSKDTAHRTYGFMCAEHIRIMLEANSGNVVYQDSHLLIAWRTCFGQESPELFVCVRCGRTGLFTYMPQIVMGGTNVTPPLSSFRAARQAVRDWKGQTLTGDLIGSNSIRLCKALGIDVKGSTGIIRRSQRNKGFGDPGGRGRRSIQLLNC